MVNLSELVHQDVCFFGVVAFLLHASLLGEGSTNHFLPVLFVFVFVGVFFFSGDQFMYINSAFWARMNPQWPNEMRGLVHHDSKTGLI